MSEKASGKLLRLFVALMLAYSLITYLDRYILVPASLESFDFRAYYSAAWAVRERLNLYDHGVLRSLGPPDVEVGAYLYPPLLAFLLVPSTFLDFSVAKILWLLLNQLFLLLAIALILGAFNRKWLPVELAAVGVLTLNIYPLRLNYELGQVNVVTLFLLAATFYLFRRNKEGWAGASLALATALKVSPALFMVYFLWKKRWRLVASALESLLVLAAFSVLIIGQESSLTYLRDTLPSVLDSTNGFTWPANQGFKGLFLRLFTESPWTKPIVVNERLAVLATLSCSAILVAATAIVCRGSDIVKDKERFDLEYSMVTLVALAVASVSWDHGFVWLLLPLIVMVKQVTGMETGLAVPTSIMAVSYALGGAYAGYFRPELRHGILILLMSPKLYAVLLLWGLLVYLHRAHGRGAKPPSERAGGPLKASNGTPACVNKEEQVEYRWVRGKRFYAQTKRFIARLWR